MAIVGESLLTQYAADGHVTVRGLIGPDELDTLRQRMTAIAEGRVPSFPADRIEYEPRAREKSVATVRKINECAGRDDVFLAHAANAAILDIVESLIGPDIKLYGSQCFMKPPGGIEKPYHQDSAYFPIEPRELVTCWAALDHATVENGCLWVIPGSQRGPLLDHDEPWMVGDRKDRQVRGEQIDREREVPIELKAGDCSFHHSMLLHRSGPNRTDRPRRGLAVHYMSARSRWVDAARAKPHYRLLRGEEHAGCV